MSDTGRAFLTELEGKKRSPYNDSAGKPTIGVGHLIKPGEVFDRPLTDSEIDKLLENDLSIAENCINKTGIYFNQNQFDALCCFVFNAGVTAFETSTILKDLSFGRYDLVPDELKRWVHSNGKVDLGLINRRNKEIALFTKEV